MSSINQAFEDWYRGASDTWWCVNCEEYHDTDCWREFAEPVTIVPSDYRTTLVSYEETIAASEEVSEFTLSLPGTLVSDDTVDMDMWIATHSVNE